LDGIISPHVQNRPAKKVAKDRAAPSIPPSRSPTHPRAGAAEALDAPDPGTRGSRREEYPGLATETTPGVFAFTLAEEPLRTARFYRLRSP
jgi:hypothetical protein